MILKSHRFGIGHIFATNANVTFPLFGNEGIKEYIKRKV